MKRHRIQDGYLKKSKTICRVIPHPDYGVKLDWYYGNKLNFYVRVRSTDDKNLCTGCDFKKLRKCGLVCGNYDGRNVLKIVHEGDTLITVDGKTFVVKKVDCKLVVESAEMRITQIEPRFVEYIPEVIESGILYISKKYQTATHLCCCGCRHKVVTPLKVGFWKLTEKNGKVSLSPSIGNFNLPCKSHYYITDNRVRWC